MAQAACAPREKGFYWNAGRLTARGGQSRGTKKDSKGHPRLGHPSTEPERGPSTREMPGEGTLLTLINIKDGGRR